MTTRTCVRRRSGGGWRGWCATLLAVAWSSAPAPAQRAAISPTIGVESIERRILADSFWSIENPQDPGDTDDTPFEEVVSFASGVFDATVISDDGVAFTEARQKTEVSNFAVSGSGYARAALGAVPYRGDAEASSGIYELQFTVPVESTFVLSGSFELSGTGDPGFSLGSVALIGTSPNGVFSHVVNALTPMDERSFRYEGTAPAESLVILAISVTADLEVDPDLELDQQGDWEISFDFRLDFVDVELVGLEVVQVVQDWLNAVPLVQGKRTVVRAHLESPNPQAVRPLLHGYRGGMELMHSPLAAANPFGSVTPPVDARARRHRLGDNAWFELPRSWTTGDDLELFLELDDEGLVLGCSESAGPLSGDCRATVELSPIDAPELRFVRVRWTDTNGVEHAASNSDLLSLARTLLATFPVNAVLPSSASLRLEEATLPQSDPLLDRIVQLRSADGCNDGCDRIYYGVVTGGFVRGQAASIGGGSLSAHGVGYPQTISHEIAHLFGRPHATSSTIGPGGLTWELGACCSLSDGSDFPFHLFEDVGAGDEMCPGVEDGVTAFAQGRRPTLGEMDDGADVRVYGYEKRLRRAIDPERTFDLMSYCPGTLDRWPSRYTYEQLFLALEGPPPSARGPAADYLIVSGSVDFAADTAEITQVQHAAGIFAPATAPGAYDLRTRDGGGTELSVISFEPTQDALLDGDDLDAGSFVVYVPADPAIRTIEIVHGGSLLASRSASDNPPTVAVLSPNGGELLDGETIALSWTTSDVDGGALESIVQLSADGGLTWTTVAVGYAGQTLELPRADVAGGDGALLRVQVSDGFHHASDQSDGPFSIANNPPVVGIGSPGETPYFWNGQVIGFDGLALDQEDGMLTGMSLMWSSSLDGPLGNGESLEIPASSLTPGKHVVTLVATDSDGAQAETTKSLWVDVAVHIFADGFESGDAAAW